MNRKTLILIQGRGEHIDRNNNVWQGYDVLYSTWMGEESKFKSNENVLFNELPSEPGPANFNYQKKSTYNGLLEAKKRGYTHVLKIRNDLIPTNADCFMSMLRYDTLNFLCWHDHEVYRGCPGYLVDYLMFGSVDDMLDLWDIDENFCAVPEVILTWNYINKCNTDISYFIDDLSVKCDLHWVKPNIMLSSYQKNNRYDRYKKYDFSKSMEYLNKNYISFLSK